MSKLVAGLTLAAACCWVASAWADHDALGMVTVPVKHVLKAQPVRAIASHQTIDLRTGERYCGQVGGRGGTIVYDNTAENSGYGNTNFPDTQMGDYTGLLADGVLDTLSFSVLNGSQFDDQVLSSVDVTIDFLDPYLVSVGSFVVEGITFDPPLAINEAGLVDLTGLSDLAIALPPNVIPTFTYSNLSGGADTVGQVWYSNPVVGWSADNIYLLGSWPNYDDSDGNPLYADIYLSIGVTTPGDLAAVASTGATRVTLDLGTSYYIGYLAGHVDDSRPQRWAAVPFKLDADAKITQIDGWWFQNVIGEQIRFKIWKRTGLERPTSDADLITDRYLRPDDDQSGGPGAYLYESKLDETLELPKGDYYLTIYAYSSDPVFIEASIGWLAGGGAQREELEREYMWRAAKFPDPGFLNYNAGGEVTAPPAMTDPLDVWNECFTLRGTSESAPCAGFVRGDANGDGQVDFNDIDCFVAALIGEDGWLGCGTQYGAAGYVCANDINQDGSVDFNDIDGFVDCIINGGCQ